MLIWFVLLEKILNVIVLDKYNIPTKTVKTLVAYVFETEGEDPANY